MPFEEKVTWVGTVVTVLITVWYVRDVAAKMANTPVQDVAYQAPMIFAVVAMIVLTIVGTIAVAIGSAIGSEVAGRSVRDGLGHSGSDLADIDRTDERDVRIGQRGELIGYYVTSGLVVGALALTMLEYPHFWIAQGLFGALLAGGMASYVVKLVAYRRGF